MYLYSIINSLHAGCIYSRPEGCYTSLLHTIEWKLKERSLERMEYGRSSARTSGVGGIAPFRSSPPLLPVAFIAGDRCRKLSTPSHTFVLLGGPFLSFHYPPFLFCSIHSYLPSLPFRRRILCVWCVCRGGFEYQFRSKWRLSTG